MATWLFYKNGEQKTIPGISTCRNCDLCNDAEQGHRYCDYYLAGLEHGTAKEDVVLEEEARKYAAYKMRKDNELYIDLQEKFKAIDLAKEEAHNVD